MEKRATELEAEVAMWFAAAEAADAEEDQLHGRDQTGEKMPDWVADKKRRAEKIRNAKVSIASVIGISCPQSPALCVTSCATIICASPSTAAWAL